MDNTLWAVIIGGLLTGIPRIVEEFAAKRRNGIERTEQGIDSDAETAS